MRSDMYFSVDIEADGPIPGEYSMLSFGIAIAGSFDGKVFAPKDPTKAAFYKELRPITNKYVDEALDVTKLDRERLLTEGIHPREAMRHAAKWIFEQAGGMRPVFVGYPVVFDWLFLHWYFVKYLGESPFGFSSALDMKTIYQQKAAVTLDGAGMRDLPSFLNPSTPHTHNALEDAIRQAEIFIRLMEWSGNE